MSTRKPPVDPGEAITRVLEAEREARAAIARCEAEAEQRLADARSAARRIFRNTQRRMSRLHEICRSAVEERAQQLETEARWKDIERLPEALRHQLLEEAARATATRMTTSAENQDAG